MHTSAEDLHQFTWRCIDSTCSIFAGSLFTRVLFVSCSQCCTVVAFEFHLLCSSAVSVGLAIQKTSASSNPVCDVQ